MYIKYASTLILLSLKLHCKYGFRFNSYLIVSIFFQRKSIPAKEMKGVSYLWLFYFWRGKPLEYLNQERFFNLNTTNYIPNIYVISMPLYLFEVYLSNNILSCFYADDSMINGRFKRFYIDICMHHVHLQYINFCHLDDEWNSF